MKARLVMAFAALSIVAFVGVAQTAPKAEARCWVEPEPTVGQQALIWADGVPTKTALNVFVVDGGETYGFPVGMHSEGYFAVGYTPEHEGTLSVKVTGPERGQTKVYATCGYEVQAAA